MMEYGHCANCTDSLRKHLSSFKSKALTEATVITTETLTAREPPSYSGIKTVQFKKALEAIFFQLPIKLGKGLRKDEVDGSFGSFVDDEAEGRTVDHAESPEKSSESDWKLCEKCGRLLMALYNLYQEFVQLCKEESVIFKKYVGVHKRLEVSLSGNEHTGLAHDAEITNSGVTKRGSLDSVHCSVTVQSQVDEVIVKQETPSENGSTADELYGIGHVLPESVKVELDYSESDQESCTNTNDQDEMWAPDSDEEFINEDDDEDGGVESFLILPDKNEEYWDENNMTTETLPTKRKRGRPRKIPEQVSTISAEASSISTSKIHQCPECGKQAKSRWNLNLHIKSVHEGLRPFECENCNKRFFAKPALQHHMQRCLQNIITIKPSPSVPPSQRQNCSKSISASGIQSEIIEDKIEEPKRRRGRPKNLVASTEPKRGRGRPRKQVATETTTEPKRGRGRPPKLNFEKSVASAKLYQCPACDKKSKSRWNLSLHIKCVHQKLKPYECLSCSKKFFSKHAFQLHNRRFHEEDHSPQYICTEPGCGKSYAYPASLYSHKYTHKPVEMRPYGCDECEMRFRRSTDLSTHKAKHKKERPYLCDICPSSFKTNQALGKHMNSQHTGDQNKNLRQCNMCGKVLRNAWNLRLHIKSVHEKLKDFTCNMCGVSMSSSSNLRVHLRGVHGIRDQKVDASPKNMEAEATLVVTPSVSNNANNIITSPALDPTKPCSSTSQFNNPTPNNSFTDLMTSFLNN